MNRQTCLYGTMLGVLALLLCVSRAAMGGFPTPVAVVHVGLVWGSAGAVAAWLVTARRPGRHLRLAASCLAALAVAWLLSAVGGPTAAGWLLAVMVLLAVAAVLVAVSHHGIPRRWSGQYGLGDLFFAMTLGCVGLALARYVSVTSGELPGGIVCGILAGFASGTGWRVGCRGRWSDIGLMVVGVPLLAALAGWIDRSAAAAALAAAAEIAAMVALALAAVNSAASRSAAIPHRPRLADVAP